MLQGRRATVCSECLTLCAANEQGRWPIGVLTVMAQKVNLQGQKTANYLHRANPMPLASSKHLCI